MNLRQMTIYGKILMNTVKSTFIVAILLVILVFFLEIIFDLIDGLSVSEFFTVDFIIMLLTHKLMIIMFCVIFIFTLLINMIIFKNK